MAADRDDRPLEYGEDTDELLRWLAERDVPVTAGSWDEAMWGGESGWCLAMDADKPGGSHRVGEDWRTGEWSAHPADGPPVVLTRAPTRGETVRLFRAMAGGGALPSRLVADPRAAAARARGR